MKAQADNDLKFEQRIKNHEKFISNFNVQLYAYFPTTKQLAIEEYQMKK